VSPLIGQECGGGWGREQCSERNDDENTGMGVTHGSLLPPLA
jgi:hypothetical protein